MNNDLKRQLYAQIPWIEKYRPRKQEDLLQDDVTLHKVRKIIQDRDMPNLLLTGIPGIGKTTTLYCIANGLYKRNVRDYVLFLNASDDRGIKVVQEQITNFCKKVVHYDDDMCKHKMIILDEADNMTPKAQRLINNLLETYHHTTRFAFTCNNSSEIIESIQSRCIILRYQRLNREQVISRLKFICEREKLTYTIEALDRLALISQGDIRTAINNLQVVYNGCVEITSDNVYTICDKPKPELLRRILYTCVKRDICKALELTYELKHKGFSHYDIINGMFNVLKADNYIMPAIKMADITTIKLSDFRLTDMYRIHMLEHINHTQYMLSKGVITDLQLTACIIELCRIDEQ